MQRPPEPQEVKTEKANVKVKIDTAVISAGVNLEQTVKGAQADAYFLGVASPVEALQVVYALQGLANDIQGNLEKAIGFTDVQDILAKVRHNSVDTITANVMDKL